MNKLLLKKLEKERAKIAAARDNLRDLRDEIDSLLEPTEQGLQALEDAIETFSQQA